ncbi:hypothetical protein ABS71_15170 [bacterium SCN 62-11]|nr:hypothetical protein [Candidatus Eremiobacteraeota bacterium]ODT62834.1 MAG: hypothetical protein ABS71_15170 [bacterium SCN 62-11]
MQEIDQLIEEAQLDSSGVFSLDPEKALEKLATYQFPDPSFWVLKIVQAAVVAGVAGISVRLLRRYTLIEFQPEEQEFPDLPVLFGRIPREQNRAWQHLKRGLWSLAVQNCTFECGWPGQPRSWTYRNQWSEEAGPAGPNFFLKISPNDTSARWNAELLQVLTSRAFLCPVPLLVDGRPIQGLQRCPQHGLSPTAFPFYSDLNDDPDLAELPLPESTFQSVSQPGALVPRVHSVPRVWGRISLACLVSAHFRATATGWKPLPTPSMIYWISDGVVVDREEMDLTPGIVSCSAYISASGLPLDLSSFRLILRGPRAARARAAVKLTQLLVRHAQVPRGVMEEPAQSSSNRAPLVALGSGLALTAWMPPLGVCMLVGSLGALIWGSGQSDQLLAHLDRDLARLKDLLKRRS